MPADLATSSLMRTMRATSTANTNTAADPEQVFANITRQQYDDFYRDFGAFEDQMLARSQNDQSLVTQAKADAPKAAALTKGIADRNASRYGMTLAPEQLKERNTTITRQNSLGMSDAVNNARFAQKDLNDKLLGDMVEIGAGVNSSALGQLSSAAQTSNARNNAYTQARAQSQANTYNTIGQLGAATIFSFPF